MHKFIAIRNGPACKAGEWFIGDEVGGPLFSAKLTSGPRGSHLSQTGRIHIPFNSLASFIVEQGFVISRYELYPKRSKMITRPQQEQTEIEEFQDSNEDLIDEEFERREREETDPSLDRKSTIVVPDTYRTRDEDGGIPEDL